MTTITTMTTKAAPTSSGSRRCNAFCTLATSSSTMSHAMMTSSIALMATSSHGHEGDNRIPMQNSVCRARSPVILIVDTTSESLLKFSMSCFLTPLQYRIYQCIMHAYMHHTCITYMHHTCLIRASRICIIRVSYMYRTCIMPHHLHTVRIRAQSS
jgi:hypothetical protein